MQRSVSSHWVLAGLVVLAASFPLAAQTPPKKKPAGAGKATPSLKGTFRAKPSPDTSIKAAPSGQSGIFPNASISTNELVEFASQPDTVKRLIESSLDLARQNLTYTYGSSEPANGGLDCSGFIYYVLRQHGFAQVPRDSSGQYVWVRRARTFRPVVSRKANSFEFDELLPGDLLFWTGTYAIDRDPPVSHTMIYLGTERSSGAKVMIGSSDGRTYRGKKRWGVSVFDFVMPRTPGGNESRATFIGYARIPGLRD
jgi:cell wall-associated NlpC family hydrolase